MVAQVGLVEGRIVQRFDCYEGTSSKAKLGNIDVYGVNLFARKQA